MKAVGLIPARGGSRRLPRKNLSEFLGKPILAWTIEAALESGVFERVVVSTEDAEIANAAATGGAVVHDRPQRLAGDAAPVVEVCLEFLDAEERQGRKHDLLGCLLATAPMRAAEDIRGARALIEPGACEFSMAVTRYAISPLIALREAADGTLEPMWPELLELERERSPKLWVDNGSTYFAMVAAFRTQRTFYGKGLRGYAMARDKSVDIDERADLELARYLARQAAP